MKSQARGPKSKRSAKIAKAKSNLCTKNCGRRAKTKRSKLCSICFRANAAKSGALGSGNKSGNPGNSGNKSGNPDNAGNQSKGRSKKKAGKRSGIKRSAKVALVVKKKWLDLILKGRKDWEICGMHTNRRGWIHLAESKASGLLMGRARVVDCKELPRATFSSHIKRHCVSNLAEVQYAKIYAWVLKDAERYSEPFWYNHHSGAVI